MVLEQKILDAFELMWGLFPEPVLLVHKDRTIMGVNERARRNGVTVGTKCHSLNTANKPGELCKHCRAFEMLTTGNAVVSEDDVNGFRIVDYWVPLQGVPELYVHFAVPRTKPKAAAAR